MRWPDLAALSLERQIMVGGAVIFGLALLGISAGHWLGTREFVREQLASNAQETATALALSMSSALSKGDPAMVKTTLLPAMDRGYFRRIRVRDTAGHVVEAMELPANLDAEVPGWFAGLANLRAPVATAMVNAGWRQLGTVEVESHPEFALRQLWRNTLQTLVWLILVSLLSALLVRAWLRRLMRPLHAVEAAASAVAQRRFQTIAEIGGAPELKRFILAFNRLVGTVADQLGEEEKRAEHFRRRIQVDALTGLPNRAALDAWLPAQLAQSGRWLGLIAIDGVAALNHSEGYARGDELVVRLAAALRAVLAPDAYLARLGAATFAVVLRAEGNRIELEAEQLTRAAGSVLREFDAGALKAAAGWVPCTAVVEVSLALARADRAMATAREEGDGKFHILGEDAAPAELQSLGGRAWMAWVERAVAAGRYSLAGQDIVHSTSGAVLQREVFLRLHGDDGKRVPARIFLPLVTRAGDASNLDRIAMDLLAGVAAEPPGIAGPVAVNLAAASWRSDAFIAWLGDRLADWPGPVRPIFELREVDVAEDLQRGANFAERVRAAGGDVAIDHFGIAAGGIASLRRLLPRYVKLDASLARGLEQAERAFQIEALVRAARTLDIPVWAQVFEADQASIMDTLAGLGVSGGQGYMLAQEVEL